MGHAKVVVRYANGRVIKGFTQNFSPSKDRFHLFSVNKLSREAIEVFLKELKAVFLVRDFAGNPKRIEQKKYVEGEKPLGRKVEVTFMDGERIVGSTLSYDRSRSGFFIFPADPKSNNISVFIVPSAVRKIRQLS